MKAGKVIERKSWLCARCGAMNAPQVRQCSCLESGGVALGNTSACKHNTIAIDPDAGTYCRTCGKTLEPPEVVEK